MVNIGFFFNKKKDGAFLFFWKSLLHTEVLNWTLFWKIWKFDLIFNASIMCKNVPEAKGNEICYGKSGMVLMCILNFPSKISNYLFLFNFRYHQEHCSIELFCQSQLHPISCGFWLWSKKIRASPCQHWSQESL